ncbi:M1 family metallopeptidase [Geosporobacter ferrireducens]|uniref:Peptidase M1 membrane alanine aminopeptidase domain-containing protein n=1 Tax=Geosporobacter ferrireducens TaxID=1424294 RepID=A0A1D8GFL0_9FIRM|nr:M1 family metallopeptidase [Geosporobacter ferrireducens]AOT69685.1 hypothetical protein Gferi_08890 [Geosporobacter ferrireducens]
MKKSIIGVIGALMLWSILFTGCEENALENQTLEKSDIETVTEQTRLENKEEKVTYDLKLTFDEKSRKLTGKQEIRIENMKMGDRLPLQLWMNAYKNGKKGHFYFPEMRNRIFARGDSQGFIDIKAVAIEGKDISFEIEDELLWLDVSQVQKSDRVLRVSLDIEIQVPKISHRTGGNDKALWLGNWIPTLGIYQEEGWIVSNYLPAGDPFYTQTADYRLQITTPPEYTVVGSGMERAEMLEDNKLTIIEGNNIRDMALAISRNYREYIHKTEDDISLKLYSYSLDQKAAEAYLKELEKIMDYYGRRIGPYPYKDFDVVETEFMTGGMEYPCLIMISTQNLQEFTKGSATILHETGHQWFYGILGNNQLKDAWFDEGLTTFIQKGYELQEKELEVFYQKEKIQLKKALEGWANIALGEDLSIYTSWSHYYRVNYRRAALMHYEIYQAMGKDRYDGFLKSLYQQYQNKIVTREGFRELCRQHGGEPAVAIFNSYFNNQ